MDKSKVKDSRMYSLIVLYKMHTDFFNRSLEGIKDKDAQNRLNTKANHIAWLTGSLVQERFEMANTLGVKGKQKAHELFKDHQGIQDTAEYPSLESMKKDWEHISPLLQAELEKIEASILDSDFEMMPGVKMSYFDLIAFTTYREANIIGQIALWRRLLGYPGMNYM